MLLSIYIWGLINTIGIQHSFCQVIKTISVEFTREYSESNTKEIIKGKIYYRAPSKTVIKIENPIVQWMILEGKEMIIYYPDDKKAFRIISTWNPFSMPFFQAFVGVVKEDYGLTELGYTLANYETNDNSLISHWNPPKNLSKFLGEFILEFKDNKIIRVELRNAKGKTLSKSLYKNHILYGATYFPLEIFTIKYLKSGSTFERIVYRNPQFNSSLPQEVIDFKIPADIKVKEVKW